MSDVKISLTGNGSPIGYHRLVALVKSFGSAEVIINGVPVIVHDNSDCEIENKLLNLPNPVDAIVHNDINWRSPSEEDIKRFRNRLLPCSYFTEDPLKVRAKKQHHFLNEILNKSQMKSQKRNARTRA